MIRAVLLVAAAMFAVNALAASLASANWVHGEEELGDNTVITLSGLWSFSIGGGAAGILTTSHAQIELIAGTQEGIVKSFTDTDCTGSGQLAGLTCTGTATTPWAVDYNPITKTLRIKSMELVNHYYLPSDFNHANSVRTTVLTGDIIATPTNLLAISSVHLSSSGTHMEGAPATLTGTLTASPTGTYGIE